MEKILTLGIPTFNRARDLEILLDKIYNLGIYRKIDILVAINGSTDNTFEVVDKYRDIINVVSHEQNMGIDYNMNSIFLFSKTKYVWLFGDDDLLLDDSIDMVLDYLYKFSPNIALINCNEIEKDNKNIVKKCFFDSSLDGKLLSPTVLISQFSGIMTLLSACLIEREYWMRAGLLSEYRSKYYFHIHQIITNLSEKTSILLIGKILFSRQRGNNWNFDTSFTSHILQYYYPKTIIRSNKIFSRIILLSGIRNKIDKINIGTIIKLRSEGIIRYHELNILYRELLGFKLFFSHLVFLMPLSLCKFIVKFSIK